MEKVNVTMIYIVMGYDSVNEMDHICRVYSNEEQAKRVSDRVNEEIALGWAIWNLDWHKTMKNSKDAAGVLEDAKKMFGNRFYNDFSLTEEKINEKYNSFKDEREMYDYINKANENDYFYVDERIIEPEEVQNEC